MCRWCKENSGITFFFFFLANQAWSGTVGPRANCCHFFFSPLLIIFPEILSSVCELPYKAGGGEREKVIQVFCIFVCLCVCVCGLGSNLSHCPQNVVNGCVVGCVI